ncbi:glycoside hydrolase family 97 catalytic domain-containing protein [uncultured Draconibacterium sp.]|uniref:glycoside hydrolase family 97 protein n=1 Tax=uncultured Draconibacterium sp. TaxID=1573823 RepID=UPI0029C76423|nr:glycoside hydrolase family 97 catalytic domain-containing protein [uncultured Draconibacterium sp.]
MRSKLIGNSVLLIIFAILFSSCQQKTKTYWEVQSVDGNIGLQLYLEDGKLSYSAQIKQGENFIDAIQKSPLGIVRKDVDFTQNLKFVKSSAIKEIDEKYNVITGKNLELHNRAKELTIDFTSPEGQQLQVVLRAYNDGIAFRYVFPENKKGEFVVLGETTGFKLAPGLAWIQPYDDVTKWTPAYEAHYMNEIPIGEESPKKNGWCFPALFKSNSTWVLLSEAGLDGNFYGAHLNPDCKDGLYTIRLPEKDEAEGVYEQFAVSEKLPWASPWRVAIIGNNLNSIYASNLVRHLSPTSRVEDTSWIKPGRVAWSWLSDHDSPQDFGKQKKFVDLAVEMGWEYSLVDANWNTMKGGNIKELADYASSKNIGLLIWYNSGGPHNTVEEMVRDAMHIKEKRRAEFAKLHDLGVKGVKIDFFQSDKPGIMKLYKDILEDAAEYEIMVNFHGCAIPRGWCRTYPNLISMESVRGAECYTFSENYPENAPISNTILPVTRNVVGSMDYTPVLFSNMEMPHITSYGHELALSVLFETGWLHFADKAEAYQELSDAPKNFLKSVPVVWDESHYVTGWPGKEMIIARRRGNTWYVAGINGEKQVKKLNLPFNFLPEGTFNAELITDGESNRSFSTETIEVNAGSNIDLDLLENGGFVMTLTQ